MPHEAVCRRMDLVLVLDTSGSICDPYFQTSGPQSCDAISREFAFARDVINTLARQDSAEDISRLNVQRCTAMAWIFIPAYCFAVP